LAILECTSRLLSDLRHFQNLEALVDVSEWLGVQLWQAAFQVEVQGTTGAGDSAYAGFLAELLQGSGPFQTLKMACAVGACNVEDADSVRGILTRKEILKRIDQGWQVSSEVLPS